MQQVNPQNYVEPQSYLNFLEDKPLWFVLTIAIGFGIAFLFYFLAPKFWASKNCQEKLKELKDLREKDKLEKDEMKADIAKLKMENVVILRDNATIIGAYQMLRHNMPDLPTLDSLRKQNA